MYLNNIVICDKIALSGFSFHIVDFVQFCWCNSYEFMHIYVGQYEALAIFRNFCAFEYWSEIFFLVDVWAQFTMN